jgi:hypothetical protein
MSSSSDIEQYVHQLSNQATRENALLELSKKRENFPELAPYLWYSFGTIAALLQVSCGARRRFCSYPVQLLLARCSICTFAMQGQDFLQQMHTCNAETARSVAPCTFAGLYLSSRCNKQHPFQLCRLVPRLCCRSSRCLLVRDCVHLPPAVRQHSDILLDFIVLEQPLQRSAPF